MRSFFINLHRLLRWHSLKARSMNEHPGREFLSILPPSHQLVLKTGKSKGHMWQTWVSNSYFFCSLGFGVAEMEKYAEVTFQSVFKQFILGVGVQGSLTEWVSSSHRFCKPLKIFFYPLAWQTEQFSTWRRASEWKDVACCRRYEGSLLNFPCAYFQLSQHRMFCQPRSIKRDSEIQIQLSWITGEGIG